MAFVLKQRDSYTWPVTVEVPIDGGRFKRETFDAEFARLPQSRIHEIQLAAARVKSTLERGDEELYDTLITDQDIANEVLIGWSGVQDDKGKEVPFSESAKTELLEVPCVADAIVRAFNDSVSKAKSKN